MSNPGLNAIYNGAFAEGLDIKNTIGLGKKMMNFTETKIKKGGRKRKSGGKRKHKK